MGAQRRSTPRLRHALGEARLLRDWVAARISEDDLAARYPGDGRTILVLPGMFTSDKRTAMLRRVLTKAGYDTHGWALGAHWPGGVEILNQIDARVDAIRPVSGAPVTLIGWSLGGLVAREYAKFAPEKSAAVITLGSPFSGNPRDNRAWRMWEWAARRKIEDNPLGQALGVKPPVPTLAIWSPRDGVISPHSARGEAGERDMERAVTCGHFAMASSPSSLEAVLSHLAQTKG